MQARDNIPEKLKNFSEIGSFDEFLSRSFKNVIVSHCKTKNVAKQGGPLLNDARNVEFIKSRSNGEIIVFGKAKALNSLWKTEFYEVAKHNGTLTEI